ncbi:MAG: trypsin-like peptidase domain-containing protein, partial [Ginsengibacter sp.]
MITFNRRFCKKFTHLVFYLGMIVMYPSMLIAQDSEPDFDVALEKTAQLIVMLKADYDGVDEFGAGIIFGRQKDRLLIATAYHILHRGASKSGRIFISLKALPDKFLEATLLKHSDDGGSDLAVIQVNNLATQGFNVCSLSFDRLGNVADLKRRDSVYPVGNPNGVPWAIPPEADKVSQINGNSIVFQSAFISSGHSGGGLLDKNATLVGMTIADQPPFGRVISIDAVLKQVKLWGYPVQLGSVLPEGIKPLHAAAEKGDSNAIKNLLEICGGNVNATDSHSATPLHYAAHN